MQALFTGDAPMLLTILKERLSLRGNAKKVVELLIAYCALESLGKAEILELMERDS